MDYCCRSLGITAIAILALLGDVGGLVQSKRSMSETSSLAQQLPENIELDELIALQQQSHGWLSVPTARLN